MNTARYWGVWPPTKFYEASKLDQALAIQTFLTEQKINSYQSKIDRVEQENISNSLRSRSRSKDG